MQLIGMLDSPYVRRTAISMHLLGIAFDHLPLSVFSDLDTFRQLNPLVKAPTLICDDGTPLSDSSLIIDYLESTVSAQQRLMPAAGQARRTALQQIGIALVMAEKAVQIVYERKRPPEMRYQPWLDRVGSQLTSACALLDGAVAANDSRWLHGEHPGQADITAAVAWGFVQLMLPELVAADNYPALASLSARAEALSAFRASPLPTN